jgi:NTP pyrophosphatase (non-canonical NTP hydrolase)
MRTQPNWTLSDLQDRVRAFVHDRDWEQYHSPKNLSMSVAIEAAELMECFQWHAENSHTNEPANRQEAIDELADVLIYCLAMANALDVDDLGAAVLDKLDRSGVRYPADQYRGRYR